MILLIPFLFLIVGSFLFSGFVNKLFPRHRSFSFFFAFVNFPMLISLLQYSLFFFFPARNNVFYLIIYLVILLILFYAGRPIVLPKFKLPRASGLLNKSLSVIILFVLSLCFLRIWFWPINWDDQIYYIEQSYTIGQDRDISRFLDWGYFKNSELQFQINPSIRPGLPLLFSLAGLFSPHLSAAVSFSRFITTFYFSILLLFIAFLSRRNALIAVFLSLTCYLFINLSVLGFKESVIISQILLIIYLFSLRESFTWLKTIIVGVTFGLMAYINYSGSLISGIFFIIFLLLIPGKWFIKTIRLGAFLVMMVIFSGLEIIYFTGVATDRSFHRININRQISTLVQKAKSLSVPKPKPLKLDSPEMAKNTTASRELASYDINSEVQLYTKGKLQGYFQYQYFGLIFIFFLATLLLRFKPLLADNLTRTILIFMGFYYLIFKDVFGLLQHHYTVTLAVSHKYTVLLVPFVSIIIGFQWPWWRQVINRIHNTLSKIFLLFMAILGLFFQIYTEKVFWLIQYVLPIHSTTQHYLDVIKLAGISLLIVSLVSFFIFLLLAKKHISQYKSLGFLSLVFLFPFLLFFHTNFGLDRTMFYSFYSTPQKLMLIPGWESLYTGVSFLNKTPESSRYLFINTNLNQLGIHLTIPMTQVETMSISKRNETTHEKILKKAHESKSNYLVTPSGQFDFPQFQNVLQTSDFLIYKTNITD